MCAIAGIIGLLTESNLSALKRMNEAMGHRGPDGEGYWHAPADKDGRSVMFAHRRLSIIDLSSAGAQPMVDPVTGCVIVFNGEIYNYLELKNKLLAAGHSFTSSGDTAVMLRTMSVQSRDAVRQLRGMFAFAFWDPRDRKLVIGRDPLGIKPLYFARNPEPRGAWSLIFASELRAILASGLLVKPSLNPSALASMVWNGFVVTPDTIVSGVEPVWPGQIRVFDLVGGDDRSEFYWTELPREKLEPLEEGEVANVLQDTVRRHLLSDVPVGVFLSSGIDSAAVANLAQRASKVPIHTFTLAFAEEKYSEGAIAGRIANAIGTQHQEMLLTEEHFVSRLDAALDSLDQPTFDGLNSYYISRAIRETDLKVALVGTGGDELFGGYTSFRELPRLLHLLKNTRWLPRTCLRDMAGALSALLQPQRGAFPPQARWAKLPAIMECRQDLLSLYQLAYALFLPNFQKDLLGERLRDTMVDGLPAAMRSKLEIETQGCTELSAISLMEQRIFLGERLLRDTDSTSMSASIEVRLPLVDQILFEAANQLRDSVRYRPVGKKSILRRIGLRGLDPALFDRRKSGFVLPFNDWLRRGMSKIMDQTMRDPAIIGPVGLNPDEVARLWTAFLDDRGVYWSRVWAIFVLVRWCHRYRVYL